jgi:hypothetical protein
MYLDMHEVVKEALECVRNEISPVKSISLYS